ncbi:MAG: septum formation initiator family protein [Actinomycetota bacterium]|nr:septum formation initiator family protein [Actinomycetota bacterium]
MWQRIALALVALVALGGAAGVSSFPARAVLEQRSDIEDSSRELAEVDARIAEAEERIDELSTPEEVERLARQHYDRVYPGEEPYRILPVPDDGVDLPEGWPFLTD